MSDRQISKKLKGKVLGACVTPAMLYGLETLEKTEVLSIRTHREEFNIKLEGRTIRQNNSFILVEQ